MDNLTYEESMKELEQVVKDLESSELTLDESIEKFEKGMKLSKHCSELLEGAEKKITLLIEKEKFGENRDEFCARLAEYGVFARKYFYPLVSENKEFEKDMTKSTPRAKEYSRNIVCLPLYAHLSLADVDKICDCILQK